MNITPLKIEGAYLIESALIYDERGYFREWFNLPDLEQLREFEPVQANTSSSKKNVLRGIHYSLAKEGQSKWVTCLKGKITDVIVDLREKSPTYLQYETIDINAEDGKSVFLKTGLGHAFYCHSDNTIVSYLLSSKYNAEYELGINPFDLDINISWPSKKFILSKKDQEAPSLKNLQNLKMLP